MWDFYKKQQRMRRAERLPERAEAILSLKRQGYSVEEKASHHYVVNGILDLYPVHNQWHDRRTGERGGAKDLAIFTKERIRHYDAR